MMRKGRERKRENETNLWKEKKRREKKRKGEIRIVEKHKNKD